ELSILTEKLQKVNENLETKIRTRNEHEKFIQDRPIRRHLAGIFAFKICLLAPELQSCCDEK
ncbi:unnamed protein product, partial [Symbiodinium sp. CCMP2456]